ncbi:hypothetical protein CPC08DRAFT_714104 [Agrocybe pediades]|nr:hypothetical protein CPC08DRAFT_714104 [Agrocybe pediades]
MDVTGMDADAQAAAAAALLHALIEAGAFGPFVTYVDVAAACLYVYDYFLTIGMEVELVWKTRWSFINVLYIAQRYMPAIDTCFIGMWRQLGFLSLDQCKILPYFTGFFYMTGFMLSEMLLSFRVWALWHNSKKLAIGLPILFVMVWAPSYYAMFLYVNSLGYAPSPLPGTRGCFTVAAGEQVIGAWSGILVWNTVTLGLSLIHGIKSYRAGITPKLAAVIYRDGAYYYIFLFIFSALNIVFTLTLQPSHKVLVMSLERILHSMFASRVLLHMRSSAKVNVGGALTEWANASGTGQIGSWRRPLEFRVDNTTSDLRSGMDYQSTMGGAGKHEAEENGYGRRRKSADYEMQTFEKF